MAEWSRRESNPRPLECHSSALPTELRPHRWEEPERSHAYSVSALSGQTSGQALRRRPGGIACSPQGMRAEEIQHVLRPQRRPPPVVLAAQRVAEWVVREIHVRVRIGATGAEAGSDTLLQRVDDHVGEANPERLELAPEQLAVRTDARDVAVVVDVVGRQTAIEEPHLGV